nr:hypothetical protein [Burkholderia pseudomallei]
MWKAARHERACAAERSAMRGGGLRDENARRKCATKMRDEMRDEMHGEWPKSNRRRFKRTLVLYLTIFIDAI